MENIDNKVNIEKIIYINNIDTQPIDNIDETQPIDNIDDTQPSDNIDETQPSDNIDDTQPIDDIDDTQPIDDIELISNLSTSLDNYYCDDYDDDKYLIKCDNCGNIWDGYAQCNCYQLEYYRIEKKD